MLVCVCQCARVCLCLLRACACMLVCVYIHLYVSVYVCVCAFVCLCLCFSMFRSEESQKRASDPLDIVLVMLVGEQLCGLRNALNLTVISPASNKLIFNMCYACLKEIFFFFCVYLSVSTYHEVHIRSLNNIFYILKVQRKKCSYILQTC